MGMWDPRGQSLVLCLATYSVYEHVRSLLSFLLTFVSTSVSGNVLGVVKLVMRSIF